MPRVPPPEQCRPLVERPVDAGVNLLVEHRPARAPLPLQGRLDPDAREPYEGAAELAVWMRLGAEDRPVDAASATFLADAAAPALYGALRAYVPMPSAEIALHYVDPVSDDPWVLGVVRNRVAGDGYAVEDGELWSRDGRLLLHSRQLRRVLSTRRSA
jgi:acyl-CoA thioesterase